MCTPKAPKQAPAPVMPAVYNPIQTEMANPDSLAANLRERRRRASMTGRQSTILAGNSAGAAPTAGAKTLLGS